MSTPFIPTRALVVIGLTMTLLGTGTGHAAPPDDPTPFVAQDERVRAELARVAAADPLLHVPPRARLDKLGLTRDYLRACLGARACPGDLAPEHDAADGYLAAWLATVPAGDPERFTVIAETAPRAMGRLPRGLDPTDLDALVAAVEPGTMAFEVARGIANTTARPSAAVGRWVTRELVARWSPTLVEQNGARMLALDSETTAARACADLGTAAPVDDGGHVPRLLDLMATAPALPVPCVARVTELAAATAPTVAWAARRAALVHAPGTSLPDVARAVDAALAAPAAAEGALWNRRLAFELLVAVARRASDPIVARWVGARALDPRLSPGERTSVLFAWLQGPHPGCPELTRDFCTATPTECRRGDTPWPSCPAD